MQLYLKELTTVAEMLKNIEMMRFRIQDFHWKSMNPILKNGPHNYKQLECLKMICVAVTGY
jgi:hypothetical protein